MTGRTRRGDKAEADGAGPVLMGTDSELRAFLARILLAGGIEKHRLPRLIKAKRSQLYVDLKNPTDQIAKGMVRVFEPAGLVDPSGSDGDEDLDELAA